MTKIERQLIGKQISALIKEYREEWQTLKELISDYGYQMLYPTQDEFVKPIQKIIRELSVDDKQALIGEWRSRIERIQFDSDEKYLKQYEAYIMEEIVARARKATYWM